MRRKYGNLPLRVGKPTVVGAVFAVMALVISESAAEAKFLKQGVRPGSADRIKSLRPPPPGTRDRIKAPGERREAVASQGTNSQKHAWFWKIHAAQGAADAERWQPALASVRERRASGKVVHATGAISAIRQDYGPFVAAAAARYDVSEVLLLAVISVESRGRAAAVSTKGAQGLMQLIPATAQRFGVKNAFDASQNILGGAAYLDWLLSEFRGDPLLALAGYNAGEGAVRRHNGVPPFNETRDYVVKVLDAVAEISTLCAEPLMSPRASCRWRGDG